MGKAKGIVPPGTADMEFIVRLSDERLITPAGLDLAGLLLRETRLKRRLNRLGKPKGVTHTNYACAAGYVGLLCQGKTAFESIREMQEDSSFYCTALNMDSVASKETLRQRLNFMANIPGVGEVIYEENVNLLKNNNIAPTPCFTGHVPLNVDVTVHDNSGTKKEGVERTYQSIDGYAPLNVYLGMEGYLVCAELRGGKCHSQCPGTVEELREAIRYAGQITPEKLLVMADCGNDCKENIEMFWEEGVDFIIKRNLRRESKDAWLKMAMMHGVETTPRDGKTVYIGSVCGGNLKHPVRIVFKVEVRTILANGQMLLVPDIDVQTWWTSLENDEEDVIKLYREHATCEQFHSEIKSDIGLERFPSGHFATNSLVLKLAVLAYNILRIIGKTALGDGIKLTRRDVERFRAKTVIQNFINIAAHITTHARKTFLNLGRSNLWKDVFLKTHYAFARTPAGGYVGSQIWHGT